MKNTKAEPPRPYLKEHTWDRYGTPPTPGEKLGEAGVFSAQDFTDLKILEDLHEQMEELDTQESDPEEVDDLESEMSEVDVELSTKQRALEKVKAEITQNAQDGEMLSLLQASLRLQLEKQIKTLESRLESLRFDLDYALSGQDTRDIHQTFEEEITKLKNRMLMRHPEWVTALEAGINPTTGDKMWYAAT
jgi:chromosome segregation ATPase